MRATHTHTMKLRMVVAGILLVIPLVVFLDIPSYNRETPELAGLPFFYWWQILWLALSAGLFVVAAILIDWNGQREA
jgi:hypothetical protein